MGRIASVFPLNLVIPPRRQEGEGQGPLQRDGCPDGQTPKDIPSSPEDKCVEVHTVSPKETSGNSQAW